MLSLTTPHLQNNNLSLDIYFKRIAVMNTKGLREVDGIKIKVLRDNKTESLPLKP